MGSDHVWPSDDLQQLEPTTAGGKSGSIAIVKPRLPLDAVDPLILILQMRFVRPFRLSCLVLSLRLFCELGRHGGVLAVIFSEQQ